MAEYIEREAIAKLFDSECCGECVVCPHDDRGDCTLMNQIPAADVQPVVHGYDEKAEYTSLFGCSVCGWECWDTFGGDTSTYNYCPNCGARMDGET